MERDASTFIAADGDEHESPVMALYEQGQELWRTSGKPPMPAHIALDVASDLLLDEVPTDGVKAVAAQALVMLAAERGALIGLLQRFGFSGHLESIGYTQERLNPRPRR